MFKLIFFSLNSQQFAQCIISRCFTKINQKEAKKGADVKFEIYICLNSYKETVKKEVRKKDKEVGVRERKSRKEEKMTWSKYTFSVPLGSPSFFEPLIA